MPGAKLVSTVLLRSRFESTLMCSLLCFNMYSAARVIYSTVWHSIAWSGWVRLTEGGRSVSTWLAPDPSMSRSVVRWTRLGFTFRRYSSRNCKEIPHRVRDRVRVRVVKKKGKKEGRREGKRERWRWCHQEQEQQQRRERVRIKIVCAHPLHGLDHMARPAPARPLEGAGRPGRSAPNYEAASILWQC